MKYLEYKSMKNHENELLEVFGYADYEFDVRFVKLKMADTKWPIKT